MEQLSLEKPTLSAKSGAEIEGGMRQLASHTWRASPEVCEIASYLAWDQGKAATQERHGEGVGQIISAL